MSVDFTAIFIVFTVFGFSAAMVAIVFAGIHRGERLRHETIRAALEKGQPLPPELLEKPKPRRTDLQRGVILVALGLGISAFLAIQGEESWGVGLIPAAIGVGLFLSHRLGKADERRAPAPG